MATVAIGESAFGHFLTDSYSAPTELWFYPNVQCLEAEAMEVYGKKDADGSLVDGEITDWFQGLGASNHAVDLTGATLEEDDDANSPFYGRLRIKFAVGASVA